METEQVICALEMPKRKKEQARTTLSRESRLAVFHCGLDAGDPEWWEKRLAEMSRRRAQKIPIFESGPLPGDERMQEKKQPAPE